MSSEIDSVLVIPKTTRYGHFYLNGTAEPHTLTYEALFQYLIELDPNSSLEIADLMSKSRSFVLFPKEHLVTVLKPEMASPEQVRENQLAELRNPTKPKSEKETFIARSQRFIDKLVKRD